MERLKVTLDKVMRQLAKKTQSKNRPAYYWEKAVDKKTLKHTKVAGLKDKNLIINVDNASWLYELSTQKNQITKKLLDLSGRSINNVKFRLGEI
ncbi:MAG: DciA family protein [Candidatus Omnitrophota bacterium]